MKKLTSLCVACGVLLISAAGWALSTAQRVAAAQELVDAFTHRYAPLPWKIVRWKLDFPATTRQLLDAAARARSDQEMYEAMTNFIAQFHDPHVSLQFPSTYSASLGFTVDAIGDAVLITDIDRDHLSEKNFPFALGDQLMAIDSTPVETLLQQLGRHEETGNDRFTRQFAARDLTDRSQSQFPFPPPAALVPVTVRSAATGQDSTVLVAWRSEGELISTFVDHSADSASAMTWLMSSSAKHVRAMQSSGDAWLRAMDRALWPQWDTVAAQKLMGASDPFFALGENFVEIRHRPLVIGIFVTRGHRIGFVRLPTWNVTDDVKKDLLAALQFEIPYLQSHTDALIIDQTHNPGGSLCLGETVAGFFLEQPIPAVRFQFKPTRLVLDNYAQPLIAMDPHSAVYQQQSALVAAVRTALKNGDALTPPLPMCSTDGLVPPFFDKDKSPVVYSKPKLLLIDALSCSTADMFPALLQDAGVVKTFGEATSGCGGSVEEWNLSGYSDVTAHITASLMVRPRAVPSAVGDTHYLENIGVTPDIPFTILASDYVDAYARYREAALDAAVGMIGRQSSVAGRQ